jgi:hypothetical protein
MALTVTVLTAQTDMFVTVKAGNHHRQKQKERNHLMMSKQTVDINPNWCIILYIN